MPQPPTPESEIDRDLARLAATRDHWNAGGGFTLQQRSELVQACLDGLAANASGWIEAACQAKAVVPHGPAGAEEITAGPMATIRFLRLLQLTFVECQRAGATWDEPLKTGPVGHTIATVFPTRAGLYDELLFRGFRCHAWLQRQAPHPGPLSKRFSPERIAEQESAVCLVLGAGNVSSIAPTDVFTKLFLHGRAVVLKLNPVNDHLGPIFERAFAPLVAEGALQIVYGGADVGGYLIEHRDVDEVHITGSLAAHDAIVWGPSPEERAERKQKDEPRLDKPITSELGNVTPWIVVPGRYSAKQLDFQAQNIVASIVNNASFNCVATKMIITHRQWPQREEFFGRIEDLLRVVRPRAAYYPGARERFERFAQRTAPADSDALPWTLLRDADPQRDPHLFREESFVCVTAETALDAPDAETFVDRVADFANDQLWGTLGASITVPHDFRQKAGGEARLWRCVDRLRYGTVAINQWSGLAFAMMGSPWGGYPGATLADPQSGIGWVHNVRMLPDVEKSVFEGPLMVFPKPLWFPTHGRAAPLARGVLALYESPSLFGLPRVLLPAMLG
ncbi:MAG: aldehyde dehydrogenase family protein [Pirellulales bacterium]